jgi:hypothetical protein
MFMAGIGTEGCGGKPIQNRSDFRLAPVGNPVDLPMGTGPDASQGGLWGEIILCGEATW